LYFNNLSVDATDVSLQEFLASRGIELPLDNISVRLYPNSAAAKVTITREVTEQLVNWAIDRTQLHGRNVEASSVVRKVDRVGGRDYSRTHKNSAEYRFTEEEES